MKKILLNEPYGMEQATLDGDKTKTRRVIPQTILDYVPLYQQEYYENTLQSISVEDAILNMVGPEKMFRRYVYQVGEIVAIAQSYKKLANDRNHEIRSKIMENSFKVREPFRGAGFENKMFVKAEHMPHHIKITGIRVEHLQDITDEDCLKEGIQVLKGGFRNQDAYTFKGDKVWFKTPRKAFAALINKVSKKGTWHDNPLVFVYSYELID